MIFSTVASACAYCLTDHTEDELCATLCSHCNTLHLLQDLAGGACPRVTASTQPTFNSTVPCEFCPEQHGLTIQREDPTKKPLSINCLECFGAGELALMVACCETGCLECGFLGMVPNPSVRRAHMKPVRRVQVGEQRECAICLEGMREGEAVFRMQCSHEFHYLCMAEWLLARRTCPCCRRTDLFLQVDADFIAHYRSLRGETAPPVCAYINEHGQVVEGEEEEDEELEEDGETEENHAAYPDEEEEPFSDGEADEDDFDDSGDFLTGNHNGFDETLVGRILQGMGMLWSGSSAECAFVGGTNNFDDLFIE